MKKTYSSPFFAQEIFETSDVIAVSVFRYVPVIVNENNDEIPDVDVQTRHFNG